MEITQEKAQKNEHIGEQEYILGIYSIIANFCEQTFIKQVIHITHRN